jgi:hypothetical protein
LTIGQQHRDHFTNGQRVISCRSNGAFGFAQPTSQPFVKINEPFLAYVRTANPIGKSNFKKYKF